MTNKNLLLLNEDLRVQIELYKALLNTKASLTSFLGSENMLYKKTVNELIEKGIHTYKLTIPSDEEIANGKQCSTYVTKSNGKRKNIKGRSKDSFYKAIFNFYFEEEKEKEKINITIEKVYNNKFSVKMNFSEYLINVLEFATDSVNRFKNIYNKHFLNSPISKKSILKITRDEWIDFFNDLKKYCLENDMSCKEFYNVKWFLNTIFNYLINEEIITKNPIRSIRTSLKTLRKEAKENDEARVYFPSEKKLFLEELERRIANETITYKLTVLYAIRILFLTGMRLGELTALKFTDIEFNLKQIHIQRKEGKNGVLANYGKGYKNRTINVDSYTIELINKIKETEYKGEYLLYNYKGERRRKRDIDREIRSICNAIGIREKSAHDIRRTYASELHFLGVSEEFIRKQLGHADLATTRGYFYNIYENQTLQDFQAKLIALNTV